MSTRKDHALRRLVKSERFPQPPILRLQYPIMLMHGFGVLAGLRRGGHLHDAALFLRQYGIHAYAPNVASYNTVAVRSAMWQDRLSHILEETGASKVNLIAHSMGGLDARFLISRLGLHEHVASLVTVSTPHHGTEIANLMLRQPERLRKWAAEVANWLGSNALDDAKADVLHALSELTPEHLTTEFNPSTPDHIDIRYWSYASQAGKETTTAINPFLMLFNTMLFQKEGLNDGMVSVSSARWGTFLGTLNADHAQHVGISSRPNSDFNANEFYLTIAAMIQKEGL